MSSITNSPRVYDVVVIGGGAAGIGVGVALKHAGVEDFIILERHQIGASFERWPRETRFITPSFPTNSIGMLDLNSVAIGFSPAFNLGVEHPTGVEFAGHLRAVARHYSLPTLEHVAVTSVSTSSCGFRVNTADAALSARHIIWAAGEFQYPKAHGVSGSELCQHTSTIPSFTDLDGDDFIVIGGYESGIDAAYHIARRSRRVRLFDDGCPWLSETADPSVALSTYSHQRMREPSFIDHVELHAHTPIASVSCVDGIYLVETQRGQLYQTRTAPILANGFGGSHLLVSDLFDSRADGYPVLNDRDESTTSPGAFLCGPAVRHDDHVFCFIYKYRQRFAVVAKAIASNLGLPAEQLEMYRSWGMYLDDLSCCGEECVC